MAQSAYISLVEGSAVQEMSLEDIKEQLRQYREQAELTGQQLKWNYADAAFPYEVQEKPEGENRWFYLKGKVPPYKYIVFGTGKREDGENSIPYIQVVLPDGATHGDKAKANELCKWIGKRLKAEVKLFNGRTLYYNPRK